MGFFQRHFRKIIYISFLVPILLVAFVSISHVTTWYGLSNPVSWSVYLSVGVEIAALSALAAISAQMGKKVYIPFGIVTLVQFIGNIFFAYQFINVDSKMFKDWVELVDPVVSYLGVESGNIIGHKRFLALFSGGLLPIISLSFLHMLVKFEEEDKKDKSDKDSQIDLVEISRQAGIIENRELEDINLFQNDGDIETNLKKLEEELSRLNEKKFSTTETKSEEKIITDNEQVMTDDSVIEVEPDFYSEDKPDYNMEDDLDSETKSIKVLKYTRNR